MTILNRLACSSCKIFGTILNHLCSPPFQIFVTILNHQFGLLVRYSGPFLITWAVLPLIFGTILNHLAVPPSKIYVNILNHEGSSTCKIFGTILNHLCSPPFQIFVTILNHQFGLLVRYSGPFLITWAVLPLIFGTILNHLAVPPSKIYVNILNHEGSSTCKIFGIILKMDIRGTQTNDTNKKVDDDAQGFTYDGVGKVTFRE